MKSKEKTLPPELLQKMDAYWRAANYLSVGQIYLYDNPLLKRPLALADVKHMLLGHWGTTPGQNFIYVHLNRVIKKYDLDMIYVSGPGHGGPAVVGNTYLEGTYSEIYPDISQDEAGLRKLFIQFSFPGGIPSHASPECPGSIHEGGELGYSLSHSFGAVFDNPGLIVACVVGDGEAETGPLATAWHSNKFLDPATDGAVLPILHLNGYKISNPTVLARIEHQELEQLLRGYGWTPIFVEGHEPGPMHEAMAAAPDTAVEQIKHIQQEARAHGNLTRPRWPMVVLNSPKGWTGPKIVDGLHIEGTFRAHQIPVAVSPTTPPEHLKLLEDWLKSYRPEELFDGQGRLKGELAELAPRGERRMGANPHANGGMLLRDLRMPDFREYAADVPSPGAPGIGDTHVLGRFLRDVEKLNAEQRNFRVFGPDETLSNGLEALFEATERQWDAATVPNDEFLAPTGRVMEMLSEHQCEGWLEGYLLTGRHGIFNCYEAFIHIVDSMFNQHAKWLKVTSHLPWRRKIASLNYLLASHVWRQDHNGFTHQDPGFIDHVVNKKAEIVRVYLPPDANCLLSVADHCLRSRDYVNVIVAGKQPTLDYLPIEEAIAHCTRGIGVWDWASSDEGSEPDVVMACAGDVPTLETIAATAILRRELPDLKVRVLNVVDLMRLQPDSEHPHGLSDEEFDSLFTTSRPVIFAYHGYPLLVHRLTYRRANHDNIHVRGYKEEGTTTTPFDMVMLNDLDRFHLVMDVIDRVAGLRERAAHLRQHMSDERLRHRAYTREHGDDSAQLRRVVSVLARVGTVAQALVAHVLAQVRGSLAQARNTVDYIDHEVKAVEVVEHHHVERRGRRALLLVSAHVDVVVVGAAVGQPVDQQRVAVVGEDHRATRREQGVELLVGEAVRVLAVGLQAHQVDDVEDPHLQVGQLSSEDRGGRDRLERRHVARARHHHVGLGAFVAARPVPHADPARAVGDRLLDRQVVERRLLAGDDHVDVVAAAQAVIGDRQQAVGVRREIDANDLRLLVDDVVDEARILMGEAVVVLAPNVR